MPASTRSRSETPRSETTSAEHDSSRVPGGDADKPQDVPARGWLQIVKRGWAEAKADNVPLLAAGVAFYAFLSIVPALTALVFIYGLVFDPNQIVAQVNTLGSALPADVRSVLTTQLTELAANDTGAGIGAVVSVLLALWSASGGMNNLMTAISVAYDEEEDRSFVVKRGLALLLTVGAVVMMTLMLVLVAAIPAALQLLDNVVVRLALQAARYVLLVLVITVALAVLYRVAPDRDAPKMRWVSVGAGLATLLWLVASIGFSLYAAHGSYSKYGALASVVVLLFWLWITSYAILLGAEINAESEQQTVRDTTKGPNAPLGARGAVKADSVPDEDDSVPDEDATPTESDTETGAAGSDQKRTTRTAGTSAAAHPEESVVSTPTQDPPKIGELVRQLSEDSGRLVRNEIALAKLEVGEKAKKLGVGVGAFGAAAVLALFGVGALIATAILALALVLPAWLSALIVSVVVLVIAGIAALLGKKKVSQGAPPVPTQAVADVKEDIQVIKESAKS